MALAAKPATAGKARELCVQMHMHMSTSPAHQKHQRWILQIPVPL